MTAHVRSQIEYQKVHVLGENNVSDSPGQIVMLESTADDEISLIDLYLVLDRHKIMMAIILAIVFASGVFYAVSKPRVFDHSISAQIGTIYVATAQGTELQPIEPVEVALSKITETYIPIVINEYVAQNPGAPVPALKARIPKGGDIIILESRAVDTEIQQNVLMQKVIDMVVENHRPRMEIMKSQFVTELNNARLKLAELEAPVTLKIIKKQFELDQLTRSIAKSELTDDHLIRAKQQGYETKIQARENKLEYLKDTSRYLATELKRLDQLDELLKQQISGLSGDIEQALKNRKGSAEGVDSPSMAMTALLLNNQLQNDRARLSGLQERLYITQKKQREQLMNDIRKNNRATEYEKILLRDLKNTLSKLDINDGNSLLKLNLTISKEEASVEKFKMVRQQQIERQQRAIENIRLKLNGLKATRALSEPLKSIKPVGPGKKLIVAVALVLGVFIAVFAAFGREFMLKVKQKNALAEAE
ncbi:hypothetical protein MNBD_GAMMA11-1481 [hydrothermal vent metagenome]|uniref:Polysaccharide chain length determinant N-terminal domain-containing protein n=1 Tax=hydrothermal vent metagenome TaxID=652676 RepID=A0A3B0XGF5_9ZZZZ